MTAASRNSGSRSRRFSPVEVVRMGINSLDPDVRDEVMRLAGGDVTRITVLGPFEAVVN